MDKVIISAAITGAVHTPSMSPYLPITPEQLADEAVAACEAGAAIVHIHVRDPASGKPSYDIELFQETFFNIKQRSNAILSPSTGGGGADTNLKVLKAEMASVNLGSLSGGLFPMAEEERNWQFDWEKPYLEGSYDSVFQNSFKSMAEILNACREFGTHPVCEIYDLSMINNLAFLIDRGIMDSGTSTRPLTIEFPMGALGQAPPTVDNLAMFVRTARETLGEFRFAACAMGRQTIAIQAAALAMGGDSRVGLEDSLFVGKGELATSNAEQVKEVVQIADALGREVATPDEARDLLGLKGLDKVGF